MPQVLELYDSHRFRLVESEHGRGKSNFRALSFLSKEKNIPAEDAINVKVQKGIAAHANAIASKIRALEQSRQAGESKFFKLVRGHFERSSYLDSLRYTSLELEYRQLQKLMTSPMPSSQIFRLEAARSLGGSSLCLFMRGAS